MQSCSLRQQPVCLRKRTKRTTLPEISEGINAVAPAHSIPQGAFVVEVSLHKAGALRRKGLRLLGRRVSRDSAYSKGAVPKQSPGNRAPLCTSTHTPSPAMSSLVAIKYTGRSTRIGLGYKRDSGSISTCGAARLLSVWRGFSCFQRNFSWTQPANKSCC